MQIPACNSHTTKYTFQFFTSVHSIPKIVWEVLNSSSNLYYHPNYLDALAKNHSDIAFHYVVLYLNEKPVALATIQIVNFYIESIQSGQQNLIEKLQCFIKSLQFFSTKKSYKILTCGNTFVSGEHGILIGENQNKKEIILALAKAVVNYANTAPMLKKKISAFMMKDFIKESLPITNELLELNYTAFNVEPNMVLTLDAAWDSFDDYLGAMRTKFRVKAKKALERSYILTTQYISVTNFNDYATDIDSLYKNVSSKADFNLGKFSTETFKDLLVNFPENYKVKAYFLNNKLVGFLSAMINNNNLDAHFVGIDYKYNKEFAIYQRMLYDYVQIAIENRLHRINFGRTASEIKSSVGAVPQDLTIYLRHKSSLSNKILGKLISYIKPTPFRQNKPFKAKTLVTPR